MTPSLLSSFRSPGWRRAVLLRRALAVVLLVCAAAFALRDAGVGTPQALVFARPVAAGHVVTRDDVHLLPVPDHLRPDSALTDPAAAVGLVVAAAAEVGEVATAARFVGSALVDDTPDGSVSEITTVVPVRLAEPELLPLLHHGDTVTILRAGSERAEPDVIATGGRVILSDTRTSPGTLLVGLGEDAAHAVAAASLTTALTVVLTQDLPN